MDDVTRRHIPLSEEASFLIEKSQQQMLELRLIAGRQRVSIFINVALILVCAILIVVALVYFNRLRSHSEDFLAVINTAGVLAAGLLFQFFNAISSAYGALSRSRALIFQHREASKEAEFYYRG